MTTPITPQQFHDALDDAAAADWRVVFAGATAHYRTGDFATGVRLVEAIGALADAADHHPDVDLRYGGVTVSMFTHEVDGLSERDAALAREISAAARHLGVTADVGVLQTVQLAIDALVSADVMAFWAAVLGYRRHGDEDVVDPRRRGPSLWFQAMEAPRAGRNRIHVDVSVPPDQAEARIAAALAAGGRIVSDAHAPAWWTLADPEGNEVDIATWQGRG